MYLPQPRKTICRTISAYATRDNYLILYRVGTCECYLSSWARDWEHHRRSSAAATLGTSKTAASTATHTAAEEAKETADTAVKVQSSTASLPSYCPLPPRVFFLLHAPSVQIIVLAPVPVTLILRHPQHQPHAPSPITLPSYSSPTIPCPITVLELRPTIPHHPHSPSSTASTPCSLPPSPCPHTHLPSSHAHSPCLSFGPLSPITLILHHSQHQPHAPFPNHPALILISHYPMPNHRA